MVGDDKALDVDQETGTDGGVPAVFFGRHAELGGASLEEAAEHLSVGRTFGKRRHGPVAGRRRYRGVLGGNVDDGGRHLGGELREIVRRRVAMDHRRRHERGKHDEGCRDAHAADGAMVYEGGCVHVRSSCSVRLDWTRVDPGTVRGGVLGEDLVPAHDARLSITLNFGKVRGRSGGRRRSTCQGLPECACLPRSGHAPVAQLDRALDS